MFQKLIQNKENMWNLDKENCVYRLKELAEYFAGLKNFGKQVKQDDFKDFFEKKLSCVEELTFTNSTSAGRKIILIKESLTNIKIYHYIEGNLQIKQYIIEIGNYLNHMLRIVNIKNRVLINIAQISDISYAWIVIQEYLLIMQEMLKKDSKVILLLRATFLKLASILNFPLVRLFEAESPDISSVTKYYSGELVKFVRNVLQIVPTSVFSLHESINRIFAKGFTDVPIKLAKAELKDYALFDERYALAKSTHQISLFTKGILMMEKTLMGVIEVDPKNILEDGIRKELLNLLAETFHKSLEFSSCYSSQDLQKKLDDLSKRIQCVKKSFIYIQDYVNIDGSRMWSEEMHRLINYYVDLEANSFLNRKIRIENSRYDLNKFSIPRFMPSTATKDLESVTFIGRILRYCLNYTKARNACFYPSTFTWYDYYNNEIFGIKTFNLINQFFGVEGLQGLNRLITYMNYNSICLLKKYYNKVSQDEFISKGIRNFMSLFKTPLVIQYTEKDTIKSLSSLVANICKQPLSNLVTSITNIGQLEIFKLLVTHCLKDSLEVESNILNSHLQNLNNIHLHYLRNSMEIKFKILNETNNTENINNNSNINKGNNDNFNFNKVFNSDSNNNNNQNANANTYNSEYTFLKNYYKNICQLLEDFGFMAATKTFYLDLSPCSNLIFTLATLSYNEIINYYSFNKKTNEVTKKTSNDDFDINYFIYGIMTILYQFDKQNIILFISFISNMIKQYILNMYQLKDMEALLNKYVEYPPNVVFLQTFLMEIMDNFNIPHCSFEMTISGFLLSKKISSQ
jgi:WASH complex subunit strumpellin